MTNEEIVALFKVCGVSEGMLILKDGREITFSAEEKKATVTLPVEEEKPLDVKVEVQHETHSEFAKMFSQMTEEERVAYSRGENIPEEEPKIPQLPEMLPEPPKAIHLDIGSVIEGKIRFEIIDSSNRDLSSIAQLAEITGASEFTVRRIIKEGNLHILKYCGRTGLYSMKAFANAREGKEGDRDFPGRPCNDISYRVKDELRNRGL